MKAVTKTTRQKLKTVKIEQKMKQDDVWKNQLISMNKRKQMKNNKLLLLIN